jgi:branched-chain amino acid transport system substrate-binding protein
MPATQTFVRNYEDRRKLEPGDTAALVYDSIKLIARAFEQQGKVGTEELLKGLFALPPQFGVAGSLDYVDSGNPVKAVVIVELREGDALFKKFVIQ